MMNEGGGFAIAPLNFLWKSTSGMGTKQSSAGQVLQVGGLIVDCRRK